MTGATSVAVVYGQRMWRGFCCLVMLALALPATAQAKPVIGQRATVEMTFTTTAPGASTGITYTASFRDPADPAADPPPLRRLVIGAPEGAELNTDAAPHCDADDATLKEQGESACPAESRIGTGSAVVKPMLLPAVQYRTTVFNAGHQQVELLSGDPPTPPVVVRGLVIDEMIDSPIPTCLNGGYVPADCPDDQVALSSNTLTVPPLSGGGMGSERRSYLTTPTTCPASGRWSSPVTFYYGDGVVETLVTEQPCERAVKKRPRLSAKVRVPGAGAAHARRLRVVVGTGAKGRSVLGVNAVLRRLRTRGRVAPHVLGDTEGPSAVRGRRVLSLRLEKRGLKPGRYEVTVRGRDARAVTDRFSIR